VIVLKITELAILEDDESLEGWKKLSGTRMKYISNSDARISKFLEEIERAPGKERNQEG
jgi:hypothetical protein